jgi:hypothetical protein
MRINWKGMAAGLAMVIGISGAAFGQNNWNHRNDNRPARVEQHNNVQRAPDWHNDHRAPVRTEGYRDHRAPVTVYRAPIYRGDRGRVYSSPVYRGPVYTTPYYGYSAPYYGNNGAYGYNNNAYGYSGAYDNGNAERIGFQDGLNDGRNDRVTGHSFRPTHDDNFKNATRGYAGGGEQGYKDTYRVGYEQGYQQGYGR